MTSWDTDERQALRASVRRFTEREVVPNLAAWEDAGALPRDLHRKAAAADLLGVGFPEEVGGSGGSAIDSLVVAEELIQSGGSSGLVAGLFTHGIGLPHLVEAGDPELIDAGGPPGAGRREDRVAGDHRARRRLRRRRPPHPRGPRRRRVRRDRREALHHLGDAGGLLHRRRPHRRGRRPRHLAAAAGAGHARHRRLAPAAQDGLALLRHRASCASTTSGCPPGT